MLIEDVPCHSNINNRGLIFMVKLHYHIADCNYSITGDLPNVELGYVEFMRNTALVE